MRHVVLSLDYEIFGNGAGDVRQHIVDPTRRMARIADKYELPLTLFVDMEEVLAFERHAAELARQCGYNPHQLIQQQMRGLVSGGHDAQLHLHPQWHRASLRAGCWQLDETKATVDSLFATVEQTSHYIGSRKAALEELAGMVDSGKHVTVYRAGAFSAQPGGKLIGALVENGFQIDSSVVCGMRYEDENVSLDYRKAPKKSAWRVQTDVAVEEPSGGLWEVPIASKPGRRVQQLTLGRLKAKFSRNVPKEQQSRMIKQLGVRKNPLQALKFLARPVPIKFDFHNVAPRKLHQWICNAPAPANGGLDVIVLIGHTKEHIDDSAFDDLLKCLKGDPMLRVVSFAEVASKLPPPSPPRTGRGIKGEVSIAS